MFQRVWMFLACGLLSVWVGLGVSIRDEVGSAHARPVGPRPAGAGNETATIDAAGSAALLSALWAGRTPPTVPEPLRAWIPWVLEKQEDALCPKGLSEENQEPICTWPSRLRLELRDRGGGFAMSVRTFKRMAVKLPGSGKHWPQDVRINGFPAVVLSEDGDTGDDAAPVVYLPPGTHTLLGNFQWDELPESLEAPKELGILTLLVKGNQVPHPSRDSDGRVFLKKEDDDEQEEDALDLTVHRKIQDDVPIQLVTRIELRVSGKRREVAFDRVLPEAFVPMSIDGPLPARLESTGTLRVQARPGTHVLTLTAKKSGPVTEIVRPEPSSRWPTDEAWVFEAKPSLRLATIVGVPALDPQQTTLPQDWRKFPSYAVKGGAKVQLVVQRVGDSQPPMDELTLDRQIFLDFDGGGFTVTDKVMGKLRRSWRLEMGEGAELGHVSVDGKDQLVTVGKESGRAGVELREGLLALSADSRLPFRSSFPAASWNTEFHEVKGTLHLPPGWLLFHGSGADDIPQTWLSRYHLMGLFLSLLAAMAMWRLYGKHFAVLTLCGLLLLAPVTEQPHVAVLVVLFFEAIFRTVPDGKLRTASQVLRTLSRIGMVLLSLAVARDQLRQGLYPAVARPGAQELVFEGLEPSAPRHREQKMADLFGRTSALGQDADGQMLGGLVGAGAGGGGNADGEFAQTTTRFAKETDTKLKRKAYKQDKERKEELDEFVENLDGSASVLGLPNRQNVVGKMGGKLGVQQRARNVQFEFDPKAVVQTGPGRPRWSWNRHTLTFSGRVAPDQMLSLWLIPPWLNLCLALAQIGLLGLLVLRLCGVDLPRFPGVPGVPNLPARKTGLGLLLALGLLCPGSVRAELPSQELLDQLKEKLLLEPPCAPNCASSSRLFVDAQPKMLRLRMEVSAAAQTAVPLPGSVNQWLPEQVLLDGNPAQALSLFEGERLHLVVPAGNHQVILEGRLPARQAVQIELPLKPWRVEARVEGWDLAGIHEDGVADSNLQLSRVEKNRTEGPAQLQPGTLPPLLRVERKILIGLQWEVETTIERLTPKGSAVVTEIPLLPGEQVTTPEMRVQNRKLLLNMPPSETTMSWHSSLQEQDALQLVASTQSELAETWKLQVSPMFHAEWKGPPPLRPERPEVSREPVWQPWPGEKLSVVISRPAAKAGASLTIDSASLALRLGIRSTDATLDLRLRSSQGGQHTLKLPEGATVESVSERGRQYPVQQDGQKLLLELSPGSKQLFIKWRQPGGFAFRYRTPDLELGAQAVNLQTDLHLGDGRWVLLCGGPRLGPAVLFWGELFLLIVLSLVLSRVPFTPLRTQHYLLLGFGLLLLPLSTFAIVLGWFLAIGYRQHKADVKSWALFDLRQIALVLWMLLAMRGLLEAVRLGLTVAPDMSIVGNGSQGGRDTVLRFFADRADGTLPRAWVLSLPLFAYRLLMLLWSLGLAMMLVRVLPWAYRAFGEAGLWRKVPPLRRKMAEAKPETQPDSPNPRPNPIPNADPLEFSRTEPHPISPSEPGDRSKE